MKLCYDLCLLGAVKKKQNVKNVKKFSLSHALHASLALSTYQSHARTSEIKKGRRA